MSQYRKFRRRAVLHLMAHIRRWVKQHPDKARAVDWLDPDAALNSQFRKFEGGRRIDIR